MTPTRPSVLRHAPWALIVLPGITAVVLLALTGGLIPASVAGLPDTGRVTQLGLPLAKAMRDGSAAIVIGALVVAAVLLPGRDDNPALVGPHQRRLQRVAAVGGVVWLMAAVSEIVFVTSDLIGQPADRIGFGEVWFFATQSDTGRALLASLVLASVAVYSATLVGNVTGLGVSAVIALAALWPLALTGHAAGSTDHELGVNLQFLHLVPVTVWVGGLAAIAVIGSAARTPAVVRGYSRLAGWCLLLVVVSGLLSAAIRLRSLEAVSSTYGFLLSLKVLALGLCVIAGWWHRRRIAAKDDPGAGKSFLLLVLGELVVMAVATGTGVALGRTGPPATSEPVPTPAEALLGHSMPPPLRGTEWLTQWQFDSFLGPLAIIAVMLYLTGVRRLVLRGVRWRPGRTICWVAGWMVFFWATSGSPGAYGDVLFSMHMLQHMTITTLVPVLLVLGAPVTLAFRALRRRDDGSRGPREWLLVAVQSWPMRLLSHPLIAAGLFVGSIFAFYYSGLFELSLSTHTGHLLMTAHFLISGYLLANVICGVDPGPKRPAYPFRVVLLMVTFAFHAFFSISLMSSREILAEEWFSGLGRTWGAGLAEDQYLGASLGWAMGDLPLAVLAGALVVAWVRDDQREARRLDRQANRDGDAARTAYNSYLQALADRSEDGRKELPTERDA